MKKTAKYLGFLILSLIFQTQTIQAQECFELIWSDEFNTPGFPDSTKWTFEIGNNNGNNNESQYYTKRLENVRIEDTALIIEAKKENYSGFQYTSGRINTYANGHYWQYGKIEARMKLPYGQGIWPAFWMLGKNIFTGTGWPACGEIDIMELIGGGEDRDDVVYGTPHWADANNNHAMYGGSYKLDQGIFADDYHTFSVEWDETLIKWFVDGEQFHVIDITPSALNEFKKEFFIIFNLAVGGDWPGYPNASTVFPQKMYVDYVRVYQKNKIPAITGIKEVVKKQASVFYETVTSPDFNYTWTVPADASIVSGQGTPRVEVNWGCDAGLVNCQLTTLCDTYDLQYEVEVVESAIDGKGLVAPFAENLKYNVPLQIETNYSWMLSEMVSTTTSLNANEVYVNWGSKSGTISVEITNSCAIDTAKLYVEVIQQLPYPDPNEPHMIPGTIQSVHFDTGGEGFAYHDNEADNQGTGSRQDEGVDTEANDGGENIGWTIAGEWLEYTIEVEETKTYDAEFRIASTNASGKFRILFNGIDRTGTINVPSTGAWNKFNSIYFKDIELSESDTLMRVEILTGDFNLGRMVFADSITIDVADLKHLSIKVYPTIAQSYLSIDNVAENTPYVITDISGRCVSQGFFSGNTINILHLENGMYHIYFNDLHIKDNGHVFIKTGG